MSKYSIILKAEYINLYSTLLFTSCYGYEVSATRTLKVRLYDCISVPDLLPCLVSCVLNNMACVHLPPTIYVYTCMCVRASYRYAQVPHQNISLEEKYTIFIFILVNIRLVKIL